jgi:hypothetical protein
MIIFPEGEELLVSIGWVQLRFALDVTVKGKISIPPTRIKSQSLSS